MEPKAKWILTWSLVCLLAAGGAVAQEPDPEALPEPEFEGPGGAVPMTGPDLREQLGLTDEQAEKLRSLRVEQMKKSIRSRSDLMIQRMELEELLRSDTPDRAAIDQKLRQLSEAQSALLRQQVEHRLALHSLLSPEQRTKMRRQMGQRWQERGRGRAFEGRGFGPHRGCPGRGLGPGRGRGFGPGGSPVD